MKFIKTNLFDTYLLLIWLLIGVSTLVSDSITRFSYGMLLFMYIVTSISNMYFRYECYKFTHRKRDEKDDLS
jgi:hypothetical protein